MKRTLLASLSLVACGGPGAVYSISSSPGGLPFYPLVAVNKETRSYEQSWVEIDVTATHVTVIGDKLNKDLDKSQTTTTTLFIDPLHTCPRLPEAGARARKIFDSIDQSAVDAHEGGGSIDAVIREAGHDACAEPLPPEAYDIIHNKKFRELPVVADSFTVEQLPSTKPMYANINIPSGGSATGDIKLDARGVMTEAQGTKQDLLPATVASALSSVVSATLTAGGSVLASAVKPAASSNLTASAGDSMMHMLFEAAKHKHAAATGSGGMKGDHLQSVSVTMTRHVRYYVEIAEWQNRTRDAGGARSPEDAFAYEPEAGNCFEPPTPSAASNVSPSPVPVVCTFSVTTSDLTSAPTTAVPPVPAASSTGDAGGS